MAVEKFEPGPSGCMLVEVGKVVGHISLGGRELLMPIGKRTVLFEMHRYHGPMPVNKKTGCGLERIPEAFWDAYERWDLGGQLVDGDLCVLREWCPECKGSGMEIDLSIREVIGKCKMCNGSKLKGTE